MKSSLLTLTFGLILSAILVGVASNSHAKAKIAESRVNFVSSTSKELIIQVPEMNDKNLSEIRKNLELNGGMNFVAYCKNLHVIMYVMDTNIHPDYDFINTAFMNVSLGYVIKEGTIGQVEVACGLNPETIQNPAQQ